MEWSLTHFWLILALALSLAELTSGVLLLLALGVAAALTALVASLGASFEWQLVAMGVLSGILVPVAMWNTASSTTLNYVTLTAPPALRSMATSTA